MALIDDQLRGSPFGVTGHGLLISVRAMLQLGAVAPLAFQLPQLDRPSV